MPPYDTMTSRPRGVRSAAALLAGLVMAACATSHPAPAPAAAPVRPTPETRRAVTAVERCAAGDGNGCTEAGLALRHDPKAGLPQAEEATRLFARGCNLGAQDACAEEARSLVWGLGTVASVVRGAKIADAACAAGSHRGCSVLGELLRKGTGVAEDVPRAEKLLRAACDSGDGEACNGVALVLYERKPKPQADVTHFFRLACDDGYAFGCSNTAGEDGIPDAEAWTLLARACAGNVASACMKLGVRAQEGNGIPVDLAEAGRKFLQACDGGNDVACYRLGSLARSGEGVARDPARAARLFARACDGGSQAACAALAALLENGEGVDANAGHARELEETACKARVTEGCRELAWSRTDDAERSDARARIDRLCGEGADDEACEAIGRRAAFARLPDADEETRALHALERACTLGDATGCVYDHRARAWAKLPADPKLLAKACELDEREGCALQAEALAPRDPAAARKLATHSCDAGSPHGCTALADLLDRRGAPLSDLTRAAELRDKACKDGESDACRGLAHMARSGRALPRDAAKAEALETEAERLDDD